jgi:hypothetical protein
VIIIFLNRTIDSWKKGYNDNVRRIAEAYLNGSLSIDRYCANNTGRSSKTTRAMHIASTIKRNIKNFFRINLMASRICIARIIQSSTDTKCGEISIVPNANRLRKTITPDSISLELVLNLRDAKRKTVSMLIIDIPINER